MLTGLWVANYKKWQSDGYSTVIQEQNSFLELLMLQVKADAICRL
jgi:hypothetical protein